MNGLVGLAIRGPRKWAARLGAGLNALVSQSRAQADIQPAINTGDVGATVGRGGGQRASIGYRVVSRSRNGGGTEGFGLTIALRYNAVNLGTCVSTNRKSRVLRVPATTFIITHSPSRSNRRDGLGFSEERSGQAMEQVRLQASAAGSIENDRRRHLLSTRHPEMPLGRALIQLTAGTEDQYRRENRRLVCFAVAL